MGQISRISARGFRVRIENTSIKDLLEVNVPRQMAKASET